MPLSTIQRRYSFEERIQRSQQLRNQWPFAADILKTYELIVEFQHLLSLTLRKHKLNGYSCEHLPAQLDLAPLLEQFQSLVQMTSAGAKPIIAAENKDLGQHDFSRWHDLLQAYWTGTFTGDDATEAFLLHTFLQPIAEYFAANADRPVLDTRPRVCPFCGRKPVCGILRPEGDGAKRSLLCSFCSTEWDYRRLICPSCDQEQIDNLPVYTAEEFPYIRIEACDACHTFLKTIDLTKDGRAVPAVDEIGSLPLTLWAEEKGYHKLQTNLLLL